jgi:hypothetical protein
MTPENLRLDAHIRVSKVAGRQGESFISPSVQRERIEAWAQLHSGKAFLRILLVFAGLERDRIGESWKIATASAIDRGIHIAKYTPIGYEKMPDKRLRPGADAAAIHEAFVMRAAHASRTEIARRLDEIAPRPNDGRWTSPMVDRIIRNRVYMGHAYRAGRVNTDAHEPIVTATEWQAANAAPVRTAARGKRPNLLGGIARCAACRYVLAPGISGMGPTYAGAPSYRCRRTHTAGVCLEPANINARKLESYVEGIWRSQMAAEAFVVQRDSAALQNASEALTEAEEELASFACDLTARRTLGPGYHAALAARAEAVETARVELRRAASGASEADIESYDELPMTDRRRILGSSIDAVIVSRGHSRVPIEERVTILWRGEGPDDLPRRGRDNGPVRPYTPQG